LVGNYGIIINMEENTIPIENTIIKQRRQGFQPGVSGNPKGKPKGARHFSTLIREAIQKVAEGEDEPADRLIVKQLVDKAKKGDLSAIDRVIDRVDGKAEQTINLDAEIHTDDGFTKEEKEALLSLLK
jgi:hypothetical protein